MARNNNTKQKDQVIGVGKAASFPTGIRKNSGKANLNATKRAKQSVKGSAANIASKGLYSQITTAPRSGVQKKAETTKSKGTVKTSRTRQAKSTATAKPASKRISHKGQSKKPSVKVTFLGGLNEIGKNMTMFECGNDAFLLDCGMAFPEEDMMGIDIVIPDFSYVERNKEKIRGLALTHGHEDHIGAIPYLFKKATFPVYGTPLTLGLVESKLKEHHLLDKSLLHVIHPGDRIKFGCMEVEFIHVNHSIPDAVGVAIHTPAGTLVHTGDFKIDFTPAKDKPMDLARFAELGQEGVLALFADSTNAENPGYTATERKVEETLQMFFNKAENKRIIVASFASNINRIQQIIQCADKVGRKVAFSGRSMLNYMDTAEKLGYLDVPKDVIIDLEKTRNYEKNEIVLVTTGSQGEPMSALSRMANSDHRTVKVGKGDFIILSARPIPGNEKTVGSVVNELLKKGCEVVYESAYDVHVSGHACEEEEKMIFSLTKPTYFIPVHGEQKHMRKQQSMAVAMGMDENNIFVEDVGDVLEINEDFVNQLPSVAAGAILVDGSGVGDVGSVVLRDRKSLGESGLIIVVATIDKKGGKILAGPDVVSRGFVYVKESEQLMIDAKNRSKKVIESCRKSNIKDWTTIKGNVRDELSKLIYSKTKRRPMILPVIMEI